MVDLQPRSATRPSREIKARNLNARNLKLVTVAGCKLGPVYRIQWKKGMPFRRNHQNIGGETRQNNGGARVRGPPPDRPPPPPVELTEKLFEVGSFAVFPHVQVGRWG